MIAKCIVLANIISVVLDNIAYMYSGTHITAYSSAITFTCLIPGNVGV